jgi:DNA polymerase-3 subunit gamma/tau
VALALYRKYRPATFAEVVGQEHVTDPLRTSLRAGRINHAYLFSGPRGCGKTSSARILARSLNCVEGPTDEPCGRCNSCVGLAPNGPGTVDVVELDAASHGGVDDARELRDKAFYAPAESRYRVFIIDEAHMVTTQGFNALLKIVEEPPEHLIFIFATTEPDKVLTTIRSRTHHYPFRLIPPKAMRELVERNCAAEGITVEPAVFPLVIRAGGGSARDTQSVLDQLLAGAGEDGVTYERAMNLLGVTDVSLIDDLVDGLVAGDGAAVFGTVEQVVDAGHDPRRFASDLLDRFRDLVLLRAVPEAASRGLVTAPEDELARMVSQADHLGQGTLTRYAEIVHTGLIDMRGATAPRLLLELLCSRMMLPSAQDTESAVLQRVERLERRMTAGAPEATSAPAASATSATSAPPWPPAPQEPSNVVQFQRPSKTEQPAAKPEQRQQAPRAAPEPPARNEPPQRAADEPPARSETLKQPETVDRQPKPAPEPVARPAGDASSPPVEEPTPAPEDSKPPQAPGGLDAAAVRRVWSEVLAAIKATSRSVEAMLLQATVQSVEDDTVVLTHAAPPLVKRLSEPRNVEIVANALTATLGGTWQVQWTTGDSGPAPAKAAAKKPAPKFEPTRRSQQDKPKNVAPQQDQPPPPEPPDEEPPPPPEPIPEEDMLAEASRPLSEQERANQHSPEDVAIELLEQQLGARKIER